MSSEADPRDSTITRRRFLAAASAGAVTVFFNAGEGAAQAAQRQGGAVLTVEGATADAAIVPGAISAARFSQAQAGAGDRGQADVERKAQAAR